MEGNGLKNTMVTALFLATLLARIQYVFAANTFDAFRDVDVLMETLAKFYTPKCLWVKTVYDGTDGFLDAKSMEERTRKPFGIHSFLANIQWFSIANRTSTYISIDNTQPIIRMDLNNFEQAKRIIKYINEDTSKITPVPCVTYMFSEPPDSRLFPILTDPKSNRWLIRYFLIHTQTSNETRSLLLDKLFKKEQNVAALQQDHGSSSWRVLTRQLFHPSGSPYVFAANRWSRDTGLANTENVFPDQMANLHGNKLRGVTLQYSPFIAYEDIEGSLFVKPKPCIDIFLLDLMVRKYNFTYELKKPADGFWGGLKADGHYQGAVGELESDQADFTVILTRSYAREQVIDFTRTYFIDPLTFMTAQNSSGSTWKKIVTPFRTNVWVCLLISVGGGSLLYHVIYHAQATLTSSRLLSSHAFMHVLASFLSQSIHTYHSLQAGRLFLGFWFLYAFLITSYYKTSLTSTLAVPFPPPTIDTLQQLYESDFKYGLKPKTAQEMYFSASDIPLYQNMYERMTLHSNTENIRKAADGGHAFISYRSFLTFHMTLHNSDPGRKNDLRMATEEFFPSGNAWGLPKGALHQRAFNEVMLRCEEAGLIRKWFSDLVIYYSRERNQKRTLEKKGEEVGEEEESKRPEENKQVVLSLGHLQGAFFMLLLGYGGGVLILVMEMLMTIFMKTNI